MIQVRIDNLLDQVLEEMLIEYFLMRIKIQNPKCKICGYNKHIEVAHIKAVSEFSDSTLISEINDINNLIGLCPNHH